MITARRCYAAKVTNGLLVVAMILISAIITVTTSRQAFAGVPIPPDDLYRHPAGKYLYAAREAANETDPDNDANVRAVYGVAWLRVTDVDARTLERLGLMDSWQGDSLWRYLTSTEYRRAWLQRRIRTAAQIRAEDPELYAYLTAHGLRPDDVTLQIIGRNSLKPPTKKATGRAQHTEEAMMLRATSELEYAFEAMMQGKSTRQIEQDLAVTSNVNIETNRMIAGVLEQKSCTVNRQNPNCSRYAGTLDYAEDPGGAGSRQMKREMLTKEKARRAQQTAPFQGPTISPTPPPAERYRAQAMVGQNGGIDFSDVELSYLSDRPKNGQHRVDYRFSAHPAATASDQHPAGIGQLQQSSDAFFTWLALSPDKFWVNLNPDEPDRIIDPGLGSTAAGKIMLQADLQLKKSVAKVINPNTRFGRSFWDRLHHTDNRLCLSMRVWVVPAPASVYQTKDELYILKAPLSVKTEGMYLKTKPAGATAESCPKVDRATENANEALYRKLVLPKLIAAVNTDPRYAALRRIYRSRIAAQWIRDHSRTEDTGYNPVIDSGDVRRWKLHGRWTPNDVYRAYVKSYKQGEFKIKKRTRRGRRTYVQTYAYGGVDFSKVPITGVTAGQFVQHWAALARAADARDDRPVKVSANQVWFGAEATVGRPAKPVQHPSGKPTVGMVITAVGGLVLIGLIIGFGRRRSGSGRRRTLIITTLAVVLVINLITGLVIVRRATEVINTKIPTPTASIPVTPRLPDTPQPTPTTPTTPAAPPTSASPHRPTQPSSRPPVHKPKPVPHKPRWTKPRRGHRPDTPMFALRWHKRDKARLQELQPLTFSFATPSGYPCIGYDDVAFCGRRFGKHEPYVWIHATGCRCTLKQIAKSVDKDLKSRKAFGRLLPVDPFTRVSDNGNGKAKYQYWMSRLYGTDHRRVNHHILVYAQANKRSDDIKIRKIIGDIYDATR